MAIEKKPKNPVPKDYVPPDSSRYKVQDGDSWASVAQRNGMETWDLIYANFRTRDPREVNWYLRHYVGCKLQTADRDNWRFSSSADPGVIHIPRRKFVLPEILIEGKVPKEESALKRVWAGLGKSHSGDVVVVGAHDLTGKIYCLGDEYPNVKNAWINVNGYKFGLGLGGSISANFIIAHGYDTAPEMRGVAGEWDFDVALGPKLADFLKGVRTLGKAVDSLEKFQKARYLTEQAIKNAGIRKRGIYSIPIPLAGAGLHLWGGYKFGDISVWSTGIGVP